MSQVMSRVLQVSTVEKSGGAARIAWNLHQEYQKRGIRSWLAAGRKETSDPTVLQIPNNSVRNVWVRIWLRAAAGFDYLSPRLPGMSLMASAARLAAGPSRFMRNLGGVEDFDFPGAWRLMDLPPERPDIIHCHNLHGGYFDLRVLPDLSRQAPVVMTLHDTWLLTGHCAHAIGCDRWKAGCGDCPDLSIYPAIRRDATAFNWQRKHDIYARSRLHVITPSRWLMDQVDQSILSPAIIERRVIHNGLNLSVFRPGDRVEARARLGLPQEARILLFVGQGGRSNRFKDFDTIEKALEKLSAEERPYQLLLLCLGGAGREEQVGIARIRFIDFTADLDKVADIYRAADVYLHAAHADTFPNVVLEALACGTPVVATAVGGIPEQIEDGVTGFLVPPRDAAAMGSRAQQLLEDAELARRMGAAAAEHARQYFGLDRQADSYLAFFREICEQRTQGD